MKNNQIPRYNNQTNSNKQYSITNSDLVFGYWLLFGNWKLVIGDLFIIDEEKHGA